uniref:Uncharacterized protein n=1 Tax=Tanacetum cinerariifolium TaxID=118510 RepID=A0A6L2MN94_TANCI|nr:hypothetical protein [Tanacetum cinerariifolium]
MERLGYVLPQDLSVGLILNDLTSDFARFVRNYNMYNMGKTVGELHVMLIEYEKGNGKGKANGKRKDKQVYIPKPKNPKPTAKEHPDKDDTCHHCKEVGHWKRNFLVYLAELLKKKKQVGTSSSSVSKNDVLYLNAIPRDGIYEIDMHNLVPKVNSIYNVSNKRAKHNLESTFLWHYRLAQRIEKLQLEGLLKSTDDESFDQCVHVSRQGASYFITFTDDYSLYGYVYLLKHKHKVWRCEALVKRDTPDKLQQRSVKCIFIGYPKETIGYYFYFTHENKIVVARYAEFFEKSLITQEVSGRAIDLEEIQDEDTSTSEITSEILMELDAMNAEMQSMIDNNVWVLVDLPPNCKTVRSKWIFKKKTDMDGIVHTYRALLVAKGYTQLYGVDYDETFSPMADIRAIRILISIAAKVCKFQRSIYGLKQASRSWNKKIDEEIKRFGFAQNLDEQCVYHMASGSNVTFLILYVDDIIIMENHIPSLQSIKDYLGKCFAMKHLGEATFILGIKIYRDRSKRLIGFSQSAYMDKILKRYKMKNSKRGHIPMQERLDLNKKQGASTPEEVKRMQMYLMLWPLDPLYMFLVYGGNPEAELRVDCYCDAGFETNRDDIKSQTGYVLVLNRGAADWKSSKKFISGLGIVTTINKPIKMFCDNYAALLIANEPEVQKGARHYHRRYNYVRECIELGEINLLKVHTDDNLADLLRRLYLKESLLNMLGA